MRKNVVAIIAGIISMFAINSVAQASTNPVCTTTKGQHVCSFYRSADHSRFMRVVTSPQSCDTVIGDNADGSSTTDTTCVWTKATTRYPRHGFAYTTTVHYAKSIHRSTTPGSTTTTTMVSDPPCAFDGTGCSATNSSVNHSACYTTGTGTHECNSVTHSDCYDSATGVHECSNSSVSSEPAKG